MLSDDRRSRRYTMNRIAKFQADAYTLPRDCMIRLGHELGVRFTDRILAGWRI